MLDVKTRVRELQKLRDLKYSRETMTAEFKQDPKKWANIGKNLDANLDLVMQLASPGKDVALGHVLEDMGIQMIDEPHRPSSTLGELGTQPDTAKDVAASAFLQRLYTIGVRYREHPLIASFTLSPITSGSTFNPYAFTTLREKQMIAPEVDYTEFLAESMSIMQDVQRIPLYEDKPRERRHKRLTEMGQIPVESFSFTEDAKAIYKYGIGIQWSYETNMLDVPMQLLGYWVMRQAITDRILFLYDLLGVAIEFAHDQSRTHDIPADGASNDWTTEKLDDYEMRWRAPYFYNWMIAEPKAVRKFKQMDFGNDSWTMGHFARANPEFNMTGYQNARMRRNVNFIDIPNLTGEDPEEAAKQFDENDYLFMDTMQAIGQFYNTGMARDETETVMGNQSYVRYFTIGNRFYGIIPSAVEVASLA